MGAKLHRYETDRTVGFRNLRRKSHGENERTGDHPYGTGHDPNDRIVCRCAAAYLGFIQVRRGRNGNGNQCTANRYI